MIYAVQGLGLRGLGYMICGPSGQLCVRRFTGLNSDLCLDDCSQKANEIRNEADNDFS